MRVAENVPSSWRRELRARWGLTALTTLGLLLALRAGFSDWLTLRARVDDLRDDELHHGLADFGAAGTGFGIGIVVLAGLLGLALRLSGRARTALSLAGLALAALLAADLVWIGRSVDRLRQTAATEMVALRDSMEGVPTHFSLHSTTPGLSYGAVALALFALAAALLPWPERGVTIQASLGAALGVASLPLPWAQGWVYTADGHHVVQAGLWAIGFDGVATTVTLVAVIALAYAVLRAPGYRRHLWATAAGVLAVWLFFSAVLSQVQTEAEVFVLAGDGAVFGLQPTQASALLGCGAALLGVAAARAWWHGREEVPSSTGEGRWLPGALEGSLRS